MKLLFTLMSIGCMLLAFPQEPKVYFDDALSKYLLPYSKQSNEAIDHHDFERAELLFDSLLKFHLKGTYIPNLKLNKVSGGIIETDSLKYPYLLITKPSWFIEDKEIESINSLALEYKNKIDFVVLYWDSVKNLKKLEKKYSEDIFLTYVDETKNKSNSIIKTFKHSFGTPVCYFVSDKKQLISLSKRFELSNQTFDNVLLPYSETYKNIVLLLFEAENPINGTISTLDDDVDTDH